MSPFIKALIAVGLILFLVALFIFTYLLNKRTPKPEGCIDMDEECEACQMTSCSHYKKHNNKENNEKEG